MMPMMSGFEVLTELQKLNNSELKKIPIIVASNLGQQSDMDEAKKLGAIDFLVKSNVSIADFLKKVQEHLPPVKK